MAIVSAVACGLMPAWQSVRDSLAAAMHRERKLRMRRGLVIAQIAVSFIVPSTARLFMPILFRTSSLGPGFDIRQTIRAEVYLPPGVYKDSRTINPYVRRARAGLRGIPGIDGASAARIIPFTDATNFGTDLIFPDNGEKQHARFNWNAVTPDFFRVMDIPLLKGRSFAPQDNGGLRVAIVNEEFVRRYVGSREPIGTTFLWWEDKTPYQIVGVVRGTKNMTIGEDPRAQLYEPLAQIKNDRPRIQFVTKSVTPPAAQLIAVRQALRQAEPAAGLEGEEVLSAIGFAVLPFQG